MGNIAAFVGDDGILLVDSQLVELGPKIEAALKTVSDKPVKYVLNTHWHGDHSGGNEDIAAKIPGSARANRTAAA